MTSKNAAVSRTVRVSTPSVDRPMPSPLSGPFETRPRLGLSPTRPQDAAVIRIEPPPSLACATGTIWEATAAPAPPLEPPAPRSKSQGVRAGGATRSEEHTSELQSRGHLACRLLLDK